MILIDSDVLIWILRGRHDIKKRFEQVLEDGGIRIFITAVQIAEIYAGLKDAEKMETSLFIDSIHCIDIDDKIGMLAGDFLRKYQKSHGITISDAFIGAAAKIGSLNLWTLNRKHYPMISEGNFY